MHGAGHEGDQGAADQAAGVVKEIQARGLRVPGDIRVVTRYDGLRAQSCQPPLTAVNLHLDEISALAIDLLFEHINGQVKLRVVMGPTPSLVVRASSRTLTDS
jgi:DNA-binding LacI/PurR family transcriptional regulator